MYQIVLNFGIPDLVKCFCILVQVSVSSTGLGQISLRFTRLNVFVLGSGNVVCFGLAKRLNIGLGRVLSVRARPWVSCTLHPTPYSARQCLITLSPCLEEALLFLFWT